MSNRRDFMKRAIAGGVLAAAPGLFYRRLFAANGNQEFETPLALPPVVEGTLKDGVRDFQLEVRNGQRSFSGDAITPTIGISSDYLGPVIRARRSETVRFRVTNGLAEETTLHWHGLRLPGEMDGGLIR